MCHVSKLMNGLLPHPPLLSVSPRLQCATFLSSPTRSSLFLPSSESSLATCHVSELTNPLLPLSPDRKSTRLNSSHANISYAVFCLKKKKQTQRNKSILKL